MSTAKNIIEAEMPLLRPIPFKDGEDHRHFKFEVDWYYGKLDQLPDFKELGLPGSTVVVKAGEVINGASIPKVFSNIFAATGILFIGACLHDTGYKYAGLFFVLIDGTEVFHAMSKSKLDDLFASVSQLHYPEHHAAIELAERNLEWFGRGAWDDCRKKDGTYVKPPHPKGFDENFATE